MREKGFQDKNRDSGFGTERVVGSVSWEKFMIWDMLSFGCLKNIQIEMLSK